VHVSLLATLNPLGDYKDFLTAHDELYVIMQDPAMENLCKKSVCLKESVDNVIVLIKSSRMLEALDFIDKAKGNTVGLDLDFLDFSDFLDFLYALRYEQKKHDVTVPLIFHKGLFLLTIDEKFMNNAFLLHKNAKWTMQDRVFFQNIFLRTQFYTLLLKDTQIVHYPLLNNSRVFYLEVWKLQLEMFSNFDIFGRVFFKTHLMTTNPESFITIEDKLVNPHKTMLIEDFLKLEKMMKKVPETEVFL
jgi:hypothetical protein